MIKNKKLILRLTAAALSVTFFISELAYAAPDALVTTPSLTPANLILQDLSRFEAPLETANLKEFHQGLPGKPLIIHIQDAHSNFSGQKNLAAALDFLYTKYGVSLILVEGSSKEATLDPIKKIASSQEILDRTAKSFLMQSYVSGEEYLNLTRNYPLRLMGIEDRKLYFQSIENYGRLADKRTEILEYLKMTQSALLKLKTKYYPKELLDYEKNKAGSASEGPDLEKLADLAKNKIQDWKLYPNMEKVIALKDKEKTMDFNQANLEQAALLDELKNKGSGQEIEQFLEKLRQTKDSKVSKFSLFQNLLNIAKEKNINLKKYPNLTRYEEYLKEFSAVDLDQLLDELQKVEDKVYLSFLSESEDARLIRSIDRYLRLLVTAYRIQMTTKDFSMFEANEPDFSTPAYLAFINRKLLEQGSFQSLVPSKKILEDGKRALSDFYTSVSERDLAFLWNAKRILKEQNKNISVLISGGYHTRHLKELFQEEGYSYVVLAPIVTEETNQAEYENHLLSAIRKKTKMVETVSGEKKREKSVSELEADILRSQKKQDGVKVPGVAMNYGLAAARLAGAVTSDAEAAKTAVNKLEALTDNPSYQPAISSAARMASANIRSVWGNLKDKRRQLLKLVVAMGRYNEALLLGNPAERRAAQDAAIKILSTSGGEHLKVKPIDGPIGEDLKTFQDILNQKGDYASFGDSVKRHHFQHVMDLAFPKGIPEIYSQLLNEMFPINDRTRTLYGIEYKLSQIAAMLENKANLGYLLFKKLELDDQEEIRTHLSPKALLFLNIYNYFWGQFPDIVSGTGEGAGKPLHERDAPAFVDLEKKLQNIFDLNKRLKLKISAHGEDNLPDFLMPLLTGGFDRGAVGPLMEGPPNIFAGPHGPFYIIVDPAIEKDWMTPGNQIAYLVPDVSDRKVMTEIIRGAERQSLIKTVDADQLIKKIITYSQFESGLTPAPSAKALPPRDASTIEIGANESITFNLSVPHSIQIGRYHLHLRKSSQEGNLTAVIGANKYLLDPSKFHELSASGIEVRFEPFKSEQVPVVTIRNTGSEIAKIIPAAARMATETRIESPTAQARELSYQFYSSVIKARQSEEPGRFYAYQMGNTESMFVSGNYKEIGDIFNIFAVTLEFDPEGIRSRLGDKKIAANQGKVYTDAEVKDWVEAVKQMKLKNGDITDGQDYHGPVGHDYRLSTLVEALNRIAGDKVEFNEKQKEFIQFLKQKNLITQNESIFKAKEGAENIALIAVPNDLTGKAGRDEQFDRETLLHEYGHAVDFTSTKASGAVDIYWKHLGKDLKKALTELLGDGIGYEGENILKQEIAAYWLYPPTLFTDIIRNEISAKIVDRMIALNQFERKDGQLGIKPGSKSARLQKRLVQIAQKSDLIKITNIYDSVAGARVEVVGSRLSALDNMKRILEEDKKITQGVRKGGLLLKLVVAAGRYYDADTARRDEDKVAFRRMAIKILSTPGGDHLRLRQADGAPGIDTQTFEDILFRRGIYADFAVKVTRYNFETILELAFPRGAPEDYVLLLDDLFPPERPKVAQKSVVDPTSQEVVLQKGGQELIDFSSEVLVKAGQYTHRIWAEEGKFKFQSYSSKNSTPLGEPVELQPDAEFVAGRHEAGMSHQVTNDPTFSRRHFSATPSDLGRGHYSVVLKDLSSMHGTSAQWQAPVLNEGGSFDFPTPVEGNPVWYLISGQAFQFRNEDGEILFRRITGSDKRGSYLLLPDLSFDVTRIAGNQLRITNRNQLPLAVARMDRKNSSDVRMILAEELRKLYEMNDPSKKLKADVPRNLLLKSLLEMIRQKESAGAGKGSFIPFSVGDSVIDHNAPALYQIIGRKSLKEQILIRMRKINTDTHLPYEDDAYDSWITLAALSAQSEISEVTLVPLAESVNGIIYGARLAATGIVAELPVSPVAAARLTNVSPEDARNLSLLAAMNASLEQEIASRSFVKNLSRQTQVLLAQALRAKVLILNQSYPLLISGNADEHSADRIASISAGTSPGSVLFHFEDGVEVIALDPEAISEAENAQATLISPETIKRALNDSPELQVFTLVTRDLRLGIRTVRSAYRGDKNPAIPMDLEGQIVINKVFESIEALQAANPVLLAAQAEKVKSLFAPGQVVYRAIVVGADGVEAYRQEVFGSVTIADGALFVYHGNPPGSFMDTITQRGFLPMESRWNSAQADRVNVMPDIPADLSSIMIAFKDQFDQGQAASYFSRYTGSQILVADLAALRSIPEGAHFSFYQAKKMVMRAAASIDILKWLEAGQKLIQAVGSSA